MPPMLRSILVGFVLGTQATSVCVDGIDAVASIKLTCPTGTVMRDVTFAQYGFYAGSCAEGNLRRTSCGDQQNLTDRNVEWVVSSICQGSTSCDFGTTFQQNDSSETVFGDPCAYKPGKRVAVEVECGPPYPDPSFPPSLFNTDKAFSKANLNLTAKIVQDLYDIVEDATFPWQSFEQKLTKLGLDVSPASATQTPPFRYAPLVTYENYFNVPLFGFTTAWFGLFTRLSVPGYASLSFRGTLSSTEWVYNVNLENVPLPDEMRASCNAGSDIRVHKGFLALYLGGLRQILMAAVPAINAKSLLLSGHSLGSAFATLASFDLMCQGHAIHSVYTFASPRVGNPAFVRAYHTLMAQQNGVDPTMLSALPHYQISNRADLVTAIPPSAYGSSKYMHVGSTEYSYEYIPSDDERVLNMSTVSFAAWAHNVQTYIDGANMFLPLARK